MAVFLPWFLFKTALALVGEANGPEQTKTKF
jgi:hypothetical protein